MTPKALNWRCITQCGACCRLAPEERLEALEALSPKQVVKYLSLVDSDGWCKHFNKSTKRCNIYNKRPDFCDIKNLLALFPDSKYSQNMLAINSCRQHIRSIYGGRSVVLKRFEKALRT